MSVFRSQLSWLSVSDVCAWRWWVNVPQSMQWFAGQSLREMFSLPRGQSASGLVRLTSLTSQGRFPLLHCGYSNVKPLALWKGGNAGRLLLGKQTDYVLVSLSAPVGLQLPPAKCQLFLWEHLLSFENWIAITHAGLPAWSGLVLSPHDVSGWRRSQACPWPHQQPVHSWTDTWTCLLCRGLSRQGGSGASREVVYTHLLTGLGRV